MGSLQRFRDSQNESMLQRLMVDDFTRRTGANLNGKQKERLVKTVRHYMNEVAEAIPNQPVQVLNKEVLQAAVPDFLSYLRRSQQAPPEGAVQTVMSAEPTLTDDVSTRFSLLQNERNTSKSQMPNPPDFRISMENEGPSAMSIFDTVRKQREEEAQRSEAALVGRMAAEGTFQTSREILALQESGQLAKREQARRNASIEAATEFATRFVPPDPRRLMMKDVMDGNAMGSGQGTPIESMVRAPLLNEYGNGNPTLALPGAPRLRPALPQDNLIPQTDILTYKENEYNLFIYSADRDWVTKKDENRYDFSVMFDPANNRPGFGLSPAANIKFKNITRIELVKTILPVEGITTVLKKTAANSFDTALNVNILSFPYLNVYVQELDTNSYGTDYNLEQAFGVIQYDANWISDNNFASKGGFLAMIPKFLKCQKVYTPTPLATLRKMTIQIQKPDGTVVTKTPDTLDITQIASSYQLANCSGSGNTANTLYGDTSGNYIWLKSSSFFSRFIVNQGDRIALGGLTFPASYSGNQAALTDLLTFLQRPEGHIVVGIAYIRTAGGVDYYTDGSNLVGYSQYVIIQSKFNDPATGAVTAATFGNLSSSDNNTFLAGLCSNTLTAGRLINLSHQTHLVFRVITRDMDSTSRLRPDNLS
jgi:hypothetical protein